ncbi:MAG: response regulator transcription factor [Beijerinckiaceae bacterium]
MTTRILIVEDSTSFRKLLAETLRQQGYGVFEAWSLEAARKLLPSVKPGIMLLDLQLDDGYGGTLLQEGFVDNVFTIVISSLANEEDRVRCLEAGAEDYIVKPVDISETLLRIKRLEKLVAPSNSQTLTDFGSFHVDFTTRRVLHAEGGEASLSRYEYKLLRLFADWEGETIAREAIAEQVLDRRHDGSSRAVDVLVSKLRRKLDPTGRESPIRNIRGEGYRFLPTRPKS